MNQIRALPLLLLVIGMLSIGQSLWWMLFETDREWHASFALAGGSVSTAVSVLMLRNGSRKVG